MSRGHRGGRGGRSGGGGPVKTHFAALFAKIAANLDADKAKEIAEAKAATDKTEDDEAPA